MTEEKGNTPSVAEPFRTRGWHTVSFMLGCLSGFQDHRQCDALTILHWKRKQPNNTMAQPLLAKSVGAPPPGFAITAFTDTMSSSQATAVAVTSLNLTLQDVKRLAVQEKWRTHYINHQ